MIQYTRKKGDADRRKMRPSNDFQMELKKYELRFRYPEMFYRTFDGIRVMRQKERTQDVPER